MNKDDFVINNIYPKHVLDAYRDVMSYTIVHEPDSSNEFYIGIHSGETNASEFLAIGMLKMLAIFSNHSKIAIKR